MKMVWTVALLGLVLVCIPSPARGDKDSSIDAILNAPGASSAAYAYAQATRLGGDMLAANKAYVSKMTDLGKPASAFQQAVEVVKQDPANGLAWAVEAYTYADRDNPFDAFTDILLAVRYDQYNLFVTRTAGQLMAWYDSDMVNRDSLADSLRAEIGTIKIRYGDNATFKMAYDEAARIYAGDVTQNQPPPAPPAGESQYPDPNMNPYSYPDQGVYGLSYAPPYPWDWYGYCEPWSLCNPFWDGCGVFAFSSGFRHHHGFDGDRGWNGSRFGAAGARGSRGLTGPAGAIGAGGAAGFRGGRNVSTFGIMATPPGVRGNDVRGFTTSGGASRFSVWHSNGMSGTFRSSGGAFNRSTGFSGTSRHYGNFGSSYGGSTRSFSSGGVRSFSGGGFHGGGGGGGFRSGGGGFHGGGGGHGGGGHR